MQPAATAEDKAKSTVSSKPPTATEKGKSSGLNSSSQKKEDTATAAVVDPSQAVSSANSPLREGSPSNKETN